MKSGLRLVKKTYRKQCGACGAVALAFVGEMMSCGKHDFVLEWEEMDKMAKSGNIQSVSRAAMILRCFKDNTELGLSEISKRVGLHKSTTAGIMSTLKKEKFLEQSKSTGRFKLGIEFFRLSLNYDNSLKKICAPYLEQLLAVTGETVNLVAFDGDTTVYVEKKESLHSMRICTEIGLKMPLYCTSVGKAILAFLSEEEAGSILAETKMVKCTDNTIADIDSLMLQIEEIRKRGYALDLEELEYGLVCVGVPIFDATGRPFAGVSVSGPTTRMTERTLESVLGHLLAAAKSINEQVAEMRYTV